MTEIEIGNAAVCVALIVATVMILAGWSKMPDQAKQVAVAAVLMFVGYQVIEFVATSLIVIAK